MIRTGIGGWSFAGWRGGAFYPPGLRHADELGFAVGSVAAIEINATYHGLQKPESFRAWRAATPEGFVFAVKGSRFVTNRRELAGAGEAVARFFGQGVGELGDRLGPIVWQLMTTKRFEAADMAAFFDFLPRCHEGRRVRHVIEVGHPSFACAEFVELARAAGIAICYSEGGSRVPLGDRTADFAYARLQGMSPQVATGYPAPALARFAAIARGWAAGEAPAGLAYAGGPAASAIPADDVFMFMINGAKERAPAAAMALAGMLQGRARDPA